MGAQVIIDVCMIVLSLNTTFKNVCTILHALNQSLSLVTQSLYMVKYYVRVATTPSSGPGSFLNLVVIMYTLFQFLV